MPTIVTMPKWGLTMTSGTVTGWSRQEGDPVTEGVPLFSVETEKAVDDVEAPATGTLRKIVAATGSDVPVMGAVAVITAPGEELSDDDLSTLLASAGPTAAGGRASGGVQPAAREARQAARDASGRINASPAARKRAGELGIDLASVEATGPGGRITSEDVERAAAAQAANAAAPRAKTIELANGMKIAALLAGPSDATENMVFVHGLGGSQSTWASVLSDFADRYRIAAIDLPGHGGSDKPSPEAADYSIAGLAAVLGETIEKLELMPAIVVGHSLGGAVALRLALDRPKLIRGLVLVDSAGLDIEISQALLDRIAAEPSREEARRLLELFFADRRFVLDRGVEDMYANRAATGADAAIKAIGAAAFSREGQREVYLDELRKLECPAFFVTGERDAVIPPRHAVSAAFALPSSWLEIIAGVGHVPQVEAASAFSRVVNRWIMALPRS